MTVLGWKRRRWHMPVLCRRCRTIVQDGVTHVGDDEDPPWNALCVACFDHIMNLGEGERDIDPASQ